MTTIKIAYALALMSGFALAAEGWMTDYDAALKKAKAENKSVLLDFTGSDWCGWCIRLKKEVFSQKAFKEYAKDNLVTVELDFPQRKKLSADVKKQNAELMKQYKVRGFPTIILLNSDGEKIARTGYRRGGAREYVKHLKSLIKKGSE